MIHDDILSIIVNNVVLILYGLTSIVGDFFNQEFEELAESHFFLKGDLIFVFSCTDDYAECHHYLLHYSTNFLSWDCKNIYYFGSPSRTL